jgi:hypothetical protein
VAAKEGEILVCRHLDNVRMDLLDERASGHARRTIVEDVPIGNEPLSSGPYDMQVLRLVAIEAVATGEVDA